MGYEKQGFADGQKLFASNLIAIEEGIINAESTSLAHFVGEIFAYAGEDAPPGCLLCDGSAVSRSTYWELFEVIGTTYGVGDGSSTFNLPNIESRTIIGEGTGASGTEYELGAIGGEEKHAQTTEEMVPHSHWSNVAVYRQGTEYGWITNNTGSNITYAGFDTSMNGGGQPFNVMQPYIVMRYFITTGKGDPASGINPADYVVEWKANDDGWYWEKWASGKAYCRKRTLVSWTTGVSSWGNTYESMVLYTNGDYPFEFAEVPVADVYIEGSGTGNYMNGTRTAGGVFGTTTSSPQVYLQNDNSSSDYDKGGYLVTEAEGWWKTPPEAGGTETIAPTIAERFEKLETDYVVAQGISGVWTWRKWESGIAECWCKPSFTNLTCETAWGSWYYAPSQYIGDYPFAFTSAPVFTVGAHGERDGITVITGYSTETQPPRIYLARPDKVTATFNLNVNCMAVGRWK